MEYDKELRQKLSYERKFAWQLDVKMSLRANQYK